MWSLRLDSGESDFSKEYPSGEMCKGWGGPDGGGGTSGQSGSV